MAYITNYRILRNNYSRCYKMKLGDQPAFPTPVDPCPKCKKKDGFYWHYAKDSGMTNGWGECNACGAKFK